MIETSPDTTGRDFVLILAIGSAACAFGAVVGLIGIPDPYATALMCVFAAAVVGVVMRIF